MASPAPAASSFDRLKMRRGSDTSWKRVASRLRLRTQRPPLMLSLSKHEDPGTWTASSFDKLKMRRRRKAAWRDTRPWYSATRHEAAGP